MISIIRDKIDGMICYKLKEDESICCFGITDEVVVERFAYLLWETVDCKKYEEPYNRLYSLCRLIGIEALKDKLNIIE